MPKYAFAGLDINASIERLCKIWGTETVLQHLKDWVAYMDGQIAIMEKLTTSVPVNMRLDADDTIVVTERHSDGRISPNEGGGSVGA